MDDAEHKDGHEQNQHQGNLEEHATPASQGGFAKLDQISENLAHQDSDPAPGVVQQYGGERKEQGDLSPRGLRPTPTNANPSPEGHDANNTLGSHDKSTFSNVHEDHRGPQVASTHGFVQKEGEEPKSVFLNHPLAGSFAATIHKMTMDGSQLFTAIRASCKEEEQQAEVARAEEKFLDMTKWLHSLVTGTGAVG